MKKAEKAPPPPLCDDHIGIDGLARCPEKQLLASEGGSPDFNAPDLQRRLHYAVVSDDKHGTTNGDLLGSRQQTDRCS